MLFGGDTMAGMPAEGVVAAPAEATPLQAVSHTLDAIGRETFTAARREFTA